ncbi:hypothetical protein ACI6PS_03575 [Flavobacterium sp. PLA-1-15]|uniref:hypothetical protein n=1 Tax=Flavobacterium sp. PLA-1-15 TaxID=3380533 RepID=UPI003B7C8053
MKQLNNTIQRLTNHPNKSVTIINLDTGEKIVCNKKGSAIIEEFGSVEAFFESIYQSGITKIRIADRNPSGTSSTPEGEPYTISLVPPGTEAQTEAKSKESVLEEKKPPIMPGLNGGDYGSIGLNAAQIDIAGKLYDYPRVVSELQSAKAKADRLESENQELKTKLLINDTLEGKSVAKTEANAKLLEQAMPMLGMIMQKFAPVAPAVEAAAGLAGSSLSATKQQVVALLAQLDDSTALHLGKLIEKLSDDDVWIDFSELMKKHNLVDA